MRGGRRERQTDRQSDRQTYRQTESTDRHREREEEERETDRQTENREGERQTDRKKTQTDIEREKKRQTDRQMYRQTENRERERERSRRRRRGSKPQFVAYLLMLYTSQASRSARFYFGCFGSGFCFSSFYFVCVCLCTYFIAYLFARINLRLLLSLQNVQRNARRCDHVQLRASEQHVTGRTPQQHACHGAGQQVGQLPAVGRHQP